MAAPGSYDPANPAELVVLDISETAYAYNPDAFAALYYEFMPTQDGVVGFDAMLSSMADGSQPEGLYGSLQITEGPTALLMSPDGSSTYSQWVVEVAAGVPVRLYGLSVYSPDGGETYTSNPTVFRVRVSNWGVVPDEWSIADETVDSVIRAHTSVGADSSNTFSWPADVVEPASGHFTEERFMGGQAEVYPWDGSDVRFKCMWAWADRAHYAASHSPGFISFVSGSCPAMGSSEVLDVGPPIVGWAVQPTGVGAYDAMRMTSTVLYKQISLRLMSEWYENNGLAAVPAPPPPAKDYVQIRHRYPRVVDLAFTPDQWTDQSAANLFGQDGASLDVDETFDVYVQSGVDDDGGGTYWGGRPQRPPGISTVEWVPYEKGGATGPQSVPVYQDHFFGFSGPAPAGDPNAWHSIPSGHLVAAHQYEDAYEAAPNSPMAWGLSMHVISGDTKHTPIDQPPMAAPGQYESKAKGHLGVTLLTKATLAARYKDVYLPMPVLAPKIEYVDDGVRRVFTR